MAEVRVKTKGYLELTPSKPAPGGEVFVHNRMGPLDAAGNPIPLTEVPLGVSGFRAWRAVPATEPVPKQYDDHEYDIEPCACEWAPDAGTHYRVVSGSRRPAKAD